MFLLNLFDDLKLDIQDIIIEHNIKKNINDYNETVLKHNITKVANMDLSGKIGEACRVANEIYTSSDPDDTLEEYSSYLYLLLTDNEMHDFVQKIINTAITDRNSCISLLNILFDEEISEQICESFFYNEVLITAFGFTIPEDVFITPNFCDYTLNYKDNTTDDQPEMEQRFTDDESSVGDSSSEPEVGTISETSIKEINPKPVTTCEVIDNTAVEGPVKDVEAKVVETEQSEHEFVKDDVKDNETEQPKLTEPEFVKDDASGVESKKDMSSKTTHVGTYGMIMDDINKDAADMAAKVLDKVTEGITAAPETPKTTKRQTTSRKKR